MDAGVRDRGHDAAAWCQLAQPGHRYAGDAASDDDAVEWTSLGIPGVAVRVDHGYLVGQP